MSKSKKKLIRKNFRLAVFERDNYICHVCGVSRVISGRAPDVDEACKGILNAHHITDRSLMHNGGYFLENGITACEDPCYMMVEQFHITGKALEGLFPDDLYKMIGSSYELAVEKSSE